MTNKKNKMRIQKNIEKTTIILIVILSLLAPITFRLTKGTYAPGKETYAEALSILNNRKSGNLIENLSLNLLKRTRTDPLKSLIFTKILLVILFFLLFEQVSNELFKNHKSLPLVILILSPLFINLIQTSLAGLIMIILFLISLLMMIKNKNIISAVSTIILATTGIFGALLSLTISSILLWEKLKKPGRKEKSIIILSAILNLIILYYNIITINIIPSRWNLIFELNGGAVSIIIILLGLLGIKFLREEIKGLIILTLLISLIRINVPVISILLIISSARAITWMEKREWHLKGLKEVSLGLILLLIISEGIASGIMTATAEPNYQEIYTFKSLKGIKGGVLTDPYYETWLEYFGNKSTALNKSDYNKLMKSSDVKSTLETINSRGIEKMLISNRMKANLWGGDQKEFYFIITHNEAFKKEKTINKYFEIWDVNLTRAKDELTSSLP